MEQARSHNLGSWACDLAIVALVSGSLLFAGLADLPLVLWDESRLANNAAEMYQHGLGLVTTYLDQPDLWNTKPPLMIWLIVGSMHSFGMSIWALRFPSAFASIITSAVVYWFCRKLTDSRLAGIVGALVLLTTYGFVTTHVARTGDCDALLVMWTTIVTACGYHIMSALRGDARPKTGYLLAFSISLAGAILTKGVAGLLILPGILLATTANGVFLKAVRSWRVWLAFMVPLAIGGSYYIAREFAGPGYLQAVWANELGGRFGHTLEGHQRGVAFYVFGLLSFPSHDLYQASAAPWSWWALILVPLAISGRVFREGIIYILIVLISFVVIISLSTTKIAWYAAPAYPLIAIIVALSFQSIRLQLSDVGSKSYLDAVLLGLLAISVATMDFLIVQHREDSGIVDRLDADGFQSALFMRNVLASSSQGERIRIVAGQRNMPEKGPPARGGYSPQVHFYVALMRNRGIDARVVSPTYHFHPGDIRLDASSR